MYEWTTGLGTTCIEQRRSWVTSSDLSKVQLSESPEGFATDGELVGRFEG